MVVVDTTVWIDYVHGHETPYTNALDYELLHNQVITGDLLITEFLQGFRNDKDFEAAKSIKGIKPFGSSFAQSCPCKHGRDFASFVNNGQPDIL